MTEMTEEAKNARREYKRRWYQANKEKAKQYNAAYWERKAKEMREMRDRKISENGDKQ